MSGLQFGLAVLPVLAGFAAAFRLVAPEHARALAPVVFNAGLTAGGLVALAAIMLG